MPKKIIFKSIFEKQFQKLSDKDQSLTCKALDALGMFFETGQSPHGLRPKKLYENNGLRTYEARVSLSLRIVWVEGKDELVFSLVGSHDDVHRFLKNF